MTTTVLGFLDGSLSLGEMLFLGIIAVLLFGKRLPDVGRSLGKALAEFKKGLSEIHDQVDWSSTSSDSHRATYESDDLETADSEPTAPRFELPDSPPVNENASSAAGQADRDQAEPSA
jgi:sec-independent protein translocase protein TatA